MNVTIVGGGFGGIKAALELKKKHNVTLISDSDYFQYYPALYSTATGHSYKESWIALKDIFCHSKNVTIVNDYIETIDSDRSTVTGKLGKLYHYEVIIFALGSVTSYFGIEGLDAYSYGIKSQGEIKKLQKHLFDGMADGVDDEKNYVIIGAGPTGVELAGALGEYLNILRAKYNVQAETLPTISLIEAAPRVLPRSSEGASAVAEKRLKKLGINVETNKKVEKLTASTLMVNGTELASHTVIWTSGVANAPFYAANHQVFTLNERGKVIVDKCMQATPNVYVIGDNAATPYAGLAQTALHDALFVASHINGSKKKYKPIMPPSVVPIGHNWALFEWHRIKFWGLSGGILRRLADLIGYHDVMPIGWAIKSWRAGSRMEESVPEQIDANRNV